MKSLMKNWNFGKHIAATLIISFGIGILDLLFTPRSASSIGIIGGADGPTAIFLTGKVYPSVFNITIFVCGLILYSPIKKLINRMNSN